MIVTNRSSCYLKSSKKTGDNYITWKQRLKNLFEKQFKEDSDLLNKHGKLLHELKDLNIIELADINSTSEVHYLPRTLSQEKWNKVKNNCVKSVQIRSYFWSIFPRIWTEYEVSLLIQSECGKIRTRNNSVFGHFSCSECRLVYDASYKSRKEAIRH